MSGRLNWLCFEFYLVYENQLTLIRKEHEYLVYVLFAMMYR